jgi:hypothetical protein
MPECQQATQRWHTSRINPQPKARKTGLVLLFTSYNFTFCDGKCKHVQQVEILYNIKERKTEKSGRYFRRVCCQGLSKPWNHKRIWGLFVYEIIEDSLRYLLAAKVLSEEKLFCVSLDDTCKRVRCALALRQKA